MSPRSLTGRAIVLAVLAAGLLRLIATDAYLAYVKPGMRIPLAISVVVLAVLAVSSATAADRARLALEDGDHDHDHDDGHGHDHHALPRIGWWLVVPVVCIALVPLTPLGADAVADRASNQVAQASPASPDEDEAQVSGGEVPLLDFVSRTVNDPANPYPEEVVLTGFVTTAPDVEGGFVLGRFVMSCCAADAFPLLVHVRTLEEPPPLDSWVRVTGRHVAPDEGLADAERPLTRNIAVEATSIEPIDQPTEPYEAP